MATLFTLCTLETNDWSQFTANENSTGTSQVGSSYKKNGSYGAQFTVSKTDADSSFYARAYKTFTTPTKTYLKAWIKFNSMTSAGYEVVGSKAAMAIFAGTNRMAWLIIGKSGSDASLRGVYRSKGGTDTFFGSETALTVGTWYEIKLLVDKSGANPYVEWWLDGTSKGSATDSSSGSDGLGRNADRAYFGIQHVLNWEKGSYEIWMDDCGGYDADPDAAGTANLKTFDGLAKAFVKTILGLAIASVKSVDGLT